MENRYVEADLLIIGGGSAGCLAAIRALELNPELKVVIFEKGDIKYSGSIARGMDALNIVAIPNFTTPELYVETATQTCAGILDAPPSYKMAQRSFKLLKKLEGWGVYFPLDEKGNYRTLQYHPKGNFLTAMEEPNLKVIISQKAIEKGAMVLNRTMGIHLLMDGGRAAGAIGLNVRTGEMVICRANAVIMTAGGAARFSLPNSGYLYGTFDYPGNTGDSYAMAFRAGTVVTGMEHTTRFMLIKDANIPLLAISITRGGRVLDINDNILMEGAFFDHEPMKQAVAEGRGPVRVRLSHLPENKIAEIEHILFTTERPVQERFFKGRGVNFRNKDVELWHTEHQLCGGHGMSGIVVNERAETNVPGIYAAGDAACVSKGHLTGAFVFGEIAAEEALKMISAEPLTHVDDRQVAEVERKRNYRMDGSGRQIDVRDLEYKVRRLIGDYVVSPKNQYKLERWLEWAQRFSHEIEHDVKVCNEHDLTKLYEVENIILCASLSARSSLERKESRWANVHQRTDYPLPNDKQYLCHVILRRGGDPQEILTATRPVIHDYERGENS